MKRSRRDFVKTISLTGLTAVGFPEIISAHSAAEIIKEENDKGALTVLFQGDSITDGNRTRDKDWNHVMGHGYAYLIASRTWYDHPKKNLSFYNRGISGNTLQDLDARWQQDTIELKPDILSILIGVNDINAVINNSSADTVEIFEQCYKKLLDQTKQLLPATKLVLCEPFILPLGWVNKNTAMWQEETTKRQAVVKDLAKKYKAVFVALQKPFTDACKKAPAEHWIWDGIHPMPAGHELIARQWIETVKKQVSFP